MDIQAIWQATKDFANSTFFTSIAGAGAGAFAGAWTAQVIAVKTKYREQLLQEMRDTNAATMMGHAICNSLLNLKGQHAKRLKDEFDEQREAVVTIKARVAAGHQVKGPFHFKADLQTLSLPPLPIDILQQQVFDKISVAGRPLSLTTTLRQTIHDLHVTLEKRNRLIDAFKRADEPVSAEMYFGLPMSSGHTNTEYSDYIRAIYSITDDGIFFSQLLCEDLVKHNKELQASYKKRFKEGPPKVSEPDWSKEKDLLPDRAKYSDWANMFTKRDG